MASKAKFTDEELLEISNRVMGGLERTSVDLSPEEQRRQNMLNDPTGAGIPLLYNALPTLIPVKCRLGQKVFVVLKKAQWVALPMPLAE